MASTCRSCDAPVIFVPSAKTGRPMILDAKPRKGVVLGVDMSDPVPPGTLMFEEPGEQGVEAVVVDVYTDHHVTCPRAKDWAGRSRKDPPQLSLVPAPPSQDEDFEVTPQGEVVDLRPDAPNPPGELA